MTTLVMYPFFGWWIGWSALSEGVLGVDGWVGVADD